MEENNEVNKTSDINNDKDDKIKEAEEKREMEMCLTLFFVSIGYLLSKKDTRNAILILITMFILIILALFIFVNIMFKAEMSVKLIVLGGIGGFFSYCVSKLKESQQRELDNKQQQYAELIYIINEPGTNIKPELKKTLLYANKDVSDTINEYLIALDNEVKKEEISNKLLSQMQDELSDIRKNIITNPIIIIFSELKNAFKIEKATEEKEK